MTLEHHYTYRIRTDNRSDEEGGSISVYGIEVWEGARLLSQYTIADLFTSREKAEELVLLCNQLEVDPVHLADIAEDALVC